MYCHLISANENRGIFCCLFVRMKVLIKYARYILSLTFYDMSVKREPTFILKICLLEKCKPVNIAKEKKTVIHL